MTFPNYTDMLAELRAGADASASEGKQNHHIVELGAKGKYENNTARLFITQQLYTKQEIAVNTVQSDGSYYSSDKQNDLTIALSASREQKLSGKALIDPEISFTYKNSNQNYQHFEEQTSTVPVSFHADYYDYTNVAIGVPFVFTFTEKWAFLFNPQISLKTYTKRPSRNAAGDFLSKKMNRVLSIYTVGVRNRIGESSSSMLFLTYQKQTSNMQYEQYVPYNYFGYSIGLKFQMEY